MFTILVQIDKSWFHGKRISISSSLDGGHVRINMADNFQLLALLGTGTFGEAWVAKSRKHDEKCVVKVINILRLSERELDQALTEVSVLGRMHHVNIVRYLDAYVHNGALNIAMEYADGGKCYRVL